MINVICDSCKKAIPDAKSGVTVTYVQDKAICEPCREKLENSVREQMQKSKSYSLKEYQDKYIKELQKQCK
jgi:hypothetical protein